MRNGIAAKGGVSSPRRSRVVLLLAVLLLLPSWARTEEKEGQTAESEAPSHVFRDALLENMVGKWKLTGMFEGQPMNHRVEVEWVLNHQFLRIHERDIGSTGAGAAPYEAMVFVGYEASKKRYVAHWIDVFGGGAATLGYGHLEASEIKFLFDSPGQPWLTTFRWQPASRTWQWLMQSKNREGAWKEEADMKLSRETAQ